MTSVRLIYYSRASRDMSLLDLKNILNVARTNNTRLNICGMLCYEQRYFLQALEGERGCVNELYLDIAEDMRHDEVVILHYSEVEAPSFSQWDMGYASSSSQFAKLLNDLGQSSFQPSAMSGEQALQFLLQASQYQTEL